MTDQCVFMPLNFCGYLFQGDMAQVADYNNANLGTELRGEKWFTQRYAASKLESSLEFRLVVDLNLHSL